MERRWPKIRNRHLRGPSRRLVATRFRENNVDQVSTCMRGWELGYRYCRCDHAHINGYSFSGTNFNCDYVCSFSHSRSQSVVETLWRSRLQLF